MSITRGNVRTSVRDRIGDDSSSPIFASTLVNRLIDNRELLLATTKLARLIPNWYLTESTITSVASQADYSVPSNFHIFAMLERKYGTGSSAVYQEVPYVNPEEQAIAGLTRPLLALPTSIALQRKTVSLVDNDSLRLNPIPVDTTEEYRLKYYRRPVTTDITNDSEAMDIPDVWGEYLALDVAIVLLSRKGDPRVKNFKDELNRLEYDLRKMYRRNVVDQAIGKLEIM